MGVQIQFFTGVQENFDKLVENVESVHAVTSSTAKGAVNQLLTVRNWAIGYYIVEFEQNGSDRAEYGVSLLANLADSIVLKDWIEHD